MHLLPRLDLIDTPREDSPWSTAQCGAMTLPKSPSMFPMIPSFSFRRHLAWVGASALFVACARGGEVTAERTVTSEQIAALPTLTVLDSRLVCTATGGDLCPLSSAVANRLDDRRIALWEPGRQVMILDAQHPSGHPFGVSGVNPGEYAVAVAVGPYKGGIAIVDEERNRLVQYDDEGKFTHEEALPSPTPNAAPGFVGNLPVLQTIRAPGDSGIARLRLQVLTTQEKREGETVLDVPVRWLRLRGDSAVSFTPLFAVSPVYAIDTDRSIVWSPGDSFRVERRAFNGQVKWALAGDLKGLPVTARDIELRRDDVYRNAPRGQLRPGELDSMVAATPQEFPVVSGIVLEPRGRILLAGSIAPSRDSVEYLLLGNDGTPTNRLKLERRVHPLVLSGDSLLVHRPTEGEPWEVRWLVLKPGK